MGYIWVAKLEHRTERGSSVVRIPARAALEVLHRKCMRISSRCRRDPDQYVRACVCEGSGAAAARPFLSGGSEVVCKRRFEHQGSKELS